MSLAILDVLDCHSTHCLPLSVRFDPVPLIGSRSNRVPRDPRYDPLFEPLKIGPVTTKNRFYQVPHCTGMGYARPETVNAMREVNAEGGWGVVCTEYCSIHPSSDDAPFATCSLWDDKDVRSLASMVDGIHRHDALAGVELWYGGNSTGNLLTREPSLGPSSVPTWDTWYQTQRMARTDIANLRQWHREAAQRAKRAGFDIIYVYAGHGYLPAQFLSPVHNQRTDEYGGKFENRARLIKELLEDTKEVAGDECAVAFRFSVNNLDDADGITHEGEGRQLVEYLAELPDLWDVNIANFAADARTSRFVPEAAQEEYISFVKQLTSKPVVGVGRFTSPDTMVSQLKRGVLDLIGAARPSIADPFLPKKIEDGRSEDIRECIGCNMCVGMNGHAVPLHCTQNATRGEEWRRGWHPEKFESRHANESVLVVGAGPAGLEAARVLGMRGYTVTLAEATTTLGGRVSREASLPGLGEWLRARDYRVSQIGKMTNVDVYLDSRLSKEQILEFGFDHICVATGSSWRRNGQGRSSASGFQGSDHVNVITPDEIMLGASINGPVVVYDDDTFYLGGLVAELARERAYEVVLVTSSGVVSPETSVTLEQHRIHSRILEKGIRVVVSHTATDYDGANLTVGCVFSGARHVIPASTLIPVTSREPDESLYLHLLGDEAGRKKASIKTVQRIGDCVAPGPIAAAIFAGHKYGRDLGSNQTEVLRDGVHAVA